MRNRSMFIIVITLLALILLPCLALAQDTGAPAAPASDTVQLTWTALAGLVSIVLTVGLAGGFAGAVAVVKAVKDNEPVKQAIERLYESQPVERRRLIRGGAELVHEVGELADELTDSKPDKPNGGG